MKEQNDLTLVSRYRGPLMGFAALWIYFFHEWQPLFSEVNGLSTVEAFIKRIGFCGVDIFLFLSGIGLCFAIGKSSIGHFYYRRIRRLIIPFLGIALVRASLEKWNTATFFGNVTGYNFYTKSIYSFLWYVPAILTLYLIFPLFYKIFDKVKSKLLLTVGLLELWLLLSLIFEKKMRADLYGFTNRLPIFLVGILIGFLMKNKSVIFKWKWLFFVMTAVLGFYLAWKTNQDNMRVLVPTSNCCVPNFLMSISLCFLLAGGLDFLMNHAKPLGKGISAFFSFFGKISLEFYCMQEWFTKLLKPIFPKDLALIWKNLAVFAIVTAAAFLLHLYSELIWKAIELLCKPKKKTSKAV